MQHPALMPTPFIFVWSARTPPPNTNKVAKKAFTWRTTPFSYWVSNLNIIQCDVIVRNHGVSIKFMNGVWCGLGDGSIKRVRDLGQHHCGLWAIVKEEPLIINSNPHFSLFFLCTINIKPILLIMCHPSMHCNIKLIFIN